MGRSKTIPLEIKLKLIQEFNSGDGCSLLADRYRIHPTTVSRIVRNKSLLELRAKRLSHKPNNFPKTSRMVGRQGPVRSRSYSSTNGHLIMVSDQMFEANSSRDSNDSPLSLEHQRIVAFRRFFEYIDKIEEIVLLHDPEFEQAFKFTRNLNNSSMRYRYLLYELEKKFSGKGIKKSYSRQEPRSKNILRQQKGSSINGGSTVNSNGDQKFSSISMEFCNLIRAGISRATT